MLEDILQQVGGAVGSGQCVTLNGNPEWRGTAGGLELRIVDAARHLDDLGADDHGLSLAPLLSGAAVLADGHGDLVARAAFRQRLVQCRQAFQRFRHAQFLERRARTMTKQPLDVLDKAAKTEPLVGVLAIGDKQPAALLGGRARRASLRCAAGRDGRVGMFPS
jgi:hypothetical protein